jgi:quercetin dioxygenase-like cupin family protein
LQTPATGELVVEGHQVAQLAKLPDATICIDRIDRLDGMLAHFVTQFSKCTGSDVGINCYYSAEGAGFPIHYDDHPVFIVQISGCKKWQYSREPYRRAPPENFIIPADRRQDYPREEELQSVLLEAGDVLFLPAGTLHQGKGVGHSLALTIAFRGKAFPRKLIGLLKEVDAAWVYEPLDLFAYSERSEHPPDEVVADLEHRLTAFREWAASLKPADVWHYWLKDCAARPTVAPTAQLIELREDTELEVASEFPVDVNVKPENGTTHVHITYGHQTMEFDCSPRSAALLESLLKRERFKPSELQVPFAAIRGVLRLLLEFGVIHAAQGHSA